MIDLLLKMKKVDVLLIMIMKILLENIIYIIYQEDNKFMWMDYGKDLYYAFVLSD
jgi:hypothetical protein